MAPKTRKDIVLIVVYLSVIIIVLFAGLWPFDFFPQNMARLAKDGGMIDFYGRGIAYLNGADKAPGNMPLTVELFIEPEKEPSNYLAYIFTAYNGDEEVFSILQWRNNLILHAKPTSGRAQLKDVYLSNVFFKKTPVLVQVSTGEGAVSVKINGKAETVFKGISFSGSRAKTIVLGNSATGRNPFRGSVALALYGEKNRRIHSPGEGNRNGIALEVPAMFKPLKRVILSSPLHDFHMKRYYFQDIFINIFGFMPLGFVTVMILFRFTSWKGPAVYISAFVFAFLLSLSIEVAQIWLPGRNSSGTDLISNSLGAILGLLAFLHLKKKGIPYLTF